MMALGAESVFVGSGHLQVRRPRRARHGHRRGHHPLRATRARWRRPRAAWASPCAGSTWPPSRPASACRNAAGDTRSASSPSRATSPRTRASSADWARTCARCAAWPISTGSRAGPARRREHGAPQADGGRALAGRAARRSTRSGGALLGTCAGAILLAREVSPAQPSLGLLDAVVERNGYGRQAESFEAELDAPGFDGPVRGVFIRAPRLKATGPAVEVLARWRGEPVLVREGRVFAATFHPEMAARRSPAPPLPRRPAAHEVGAASGYGAVLSRAPRPAAPVPGRIDQRRRTRWA